VSDEFIVINGIALSESEAKSLRFRVKYFPALVGFIIGYVGMDLYTKFEVLFT